MAAYHGPPSGGGNFREGVHSSGAGVSLGFGLGGRGRGVVAVRGGVAGRRVRGEVSRGVGRKDGGGEGGGEGYGSGAGGEGMKGAHSFDGRGRLI